jgi:SAM-dependent methyltransferase
VSARAKQSGSTSPEPSGAIYPALGHFDVWQQAAYEFASSFLIDAPCVDFGCGYGMGAALLASRTAQPVLGLDSDDGCVRYAKRHFGGTNLTFVRKDGSSIPVPAGSLGLITACKVIEHLPPEQLLAFFGEVRRTLRPGGRLVGQTVNPDVPHREGVRYLRALPASFLDQEAKELGFGIGLYGQEISRPGDSGILDLIVPAIPRSIGRTRSMKAVQGLVMAWLSRKASVHDPNVRIEDFARDKHLTTVFVMTRVG